MENKPYNTKFVNGLCDYLQKSSQYAICVTDRNIKTRLLFILDIPKESYYYYGFCLQEQSSEWYLKLTYYDTFEPESDVGIKLFELNQAIVEAILPELIQQYETLEFKRLDELHRAAYEDKIRSQIVPAEKRFR